MHNKSPTYSNAFLLRWMFHFLRPVKLLTALACLYLTLWTAMEVTAVRYTAEAVNRIKEIHTQGAEAPSADGDHRAHRARLGPGDDVEGENTRGSGDHPRDSGDHPPGSEGDAPGLLAWITGDSSQATGLRGIVLRLAGLTACMGLLTYLREVTNCKLSMHMVFYIREAVYDKLQHAGFRFHDRLSTGELINRSLSDLQNVRAFLNSSVLITLEIVLIVGGYITVLMLRSPWVAGLALAPLPIWTWYILRFSRQAQPALKAVMETGDRDVSIIAESIAGVHVIKAFATERLEIGKYKGNCDEFFKRVIRRIRMFANFAPVIRSIATASHLTLFLAAGILIIKGRLNAGDILMLGAAMGAILGRLQQVSVINDQYQSAIVSARRLYEVLMTPPSVHERAGARALSNGAGTVRFENVTFGYDPTKPVLRNVSFEAPGGSVVAVVGPTGAGKTTLASLIARFYDPQQGRVLIDGVDIREATLQSLRTQIAYVFQETFLFSETVEANIAYGRPGIGGGQIEAAARLAQAHDFVQDLPDGYSTRLGERGASLSGGQRQRLAIARAILSNPLILILDDATAAIDPETEHDIRKAMRLCMQDRTVFVIAHRISTVKSADMVVVLENGRIAQIGTHNELLTQEGHYRQVVNLQLYGDAVGNGDTTKNGEPGDDGERLSHMDRMREFYRSRGADVGGERAVAQEEGV